MDKATISGNYIEAQKALHPALPLAKNRFGIVVGARLSPLNIGGAISKTLVKNGFHSAQAVDKDIVDITNQHDVVAFGENYFKGMIETLVISAGATHLDWIEDQPVMHIQNVLDTNLLGPILLTREFVRRTIDNPGSKYIVLIGSMAHKAVLNGSSVYCASKAGLAHYARCIAWELAPKGYNVFCVHPSNTEGAPMSEETIQGLMRYRALDRASAEAYWAASLPRHNWLQPGDIGETVSWLVSGKADYLSGSNIDMGGGQR